MEEDTGGGGTSDTRQTLTSSSSITFDYDSGNYATLTIGTNATLTFQDVPDMGKGTIVVKQDATGGRTITFAENITEVTSIGYSGGFSVVQGVASSYTKIKYERVNDRLHLSLIYE